MESYFTTTSSNMQQMGEKHCQSHIIKVGAIITGITMHSTDRQTWMIFGSFNLLFKHKIIDLYYYISPFVHTYIPLIPLAPCQLVKTCA